MKTLKEMNEYCNKRDAFRKLLDSVTDVNDLQIFQLDLATRQKQLTKKVK